MARSRELRVEVVGDTDKLRRSFQGAEKDTDRLDRSFQGLSRSSGGLQSSFSKVNQQAAFFRNAIQAIKFPALITGAGFAAQAVGALGAAATATGAALAPLSGALAAYPALGSAAAQATGVFSLALKDAQKDAGALGDELRTLTELQKALKREARAGLFPGLERGFAAANTRRNREALKDITRQTGVAGGRVAARAGRMVGSEAFTEDLLRQGGRNVRWIETAGGAALHLADALRHVTLAAGPLTGWLVRLGASWAKQIDAWAKAARQSGQLRDFFGETRQVMERLISIGGSLAGVFVAVATAAKPLGDEIFAALDRSANRFEEWAESAKGQNNIERFFARMRDPIFEMGELVGDIATAMGRLAAQPGLTKIIRKLQDLVPILEEVVAGTTAAFGPALVDLIGNVARVFGALAGTSGPLTTFVEVLSTLADGLADLLENNKAFQTFVVTLGGLAAVMKTLKFAGAISGLAGLAGMAGRLRGGGLGGGIAGRVASKAAPVPVIVMNPGFGGVPGGGKPGVLDKASRIAPIAAAGARIVPVVGAAGILYYVFSKSNRNLPTGAGEPTRLSADRTPSGGRNVGEDLAPSPNATRKVEGMGDALKRMAARARDLIPTVHKSTENLKGFRSAADKGADAANRNSKRLGNLKDSSNGFRGAAAKAVDTANRLRDRITALGGAARKGDTSVANLKSEISGLKDKKIQLQVGLSIATSDFTLEPLGTGDGWGIEGAVRKQAGIDIKKGKINPFGFISGAMGGGGNLMGADPAGAIYAAIGSRFGLGVSSGLRPGSITNSGNVSLHASGRALDIAGSTQGMLAFGKFLAAAFGSRLKELIHTPMGFSIKNGARVAPYAQADHYDHVHVGFRQGGAVVPGQGSGDKVTVGARVEPGEGLFVMNRNAMGAMAAINDLFPRFQGGGKVGPGGIPRTDWRMVKSIASRYGVDPLLLVAIGKIETDWGRLGDGRNGNVLGVGSYDTGSSYQWAGLRNQLRKGSELLKSWGATTLDAVIGGKASSWATDPGWESAVASKYREIATPHWARNAQVVGDDDAGGGGTSGGISWTTKGGRVGKKTRLPEGTTFFKSGAGVRVEKGRIVARTEASAAGRERWRNRPTLGGTFTYESELAQADRILDRAGDIDPTNKRDVAAVGGKLLLLGNRKAAIKRRLKTIRKALRGKLSRSARSRLLGEQAQLISELGGIESTSRELHESMHPEAGEDTAAQAAEDRAAAERELADQIKALKESIDEQNRITSSTVAIGLREAQRALADMISGEIGGLVGQRNRSPGDGMTAARY